MKKVKFYTAEDQKRMIEVYKNSENQAEASRKLAKELKRNVGSIQVKLSQLLRTSGTITSRSRKEENKEQNKGVLIPKGFTFDIKPSKAVMFSDHVRLYF
jgi:hypothetical protein